ncbi:MAG: GNAT family N-acetyltransferase [Arcanobacterium sp.]|nr:GNAT family N-acetyltransferase [Arcanobacterium sp.]
MQESRWYWTELTSHNFQEVVALIDAVERADNAPVRTTGQEIASFFRETKHWLAQGAWVEDELIAFGLVRVKSADELDSITISGGVAQEWRRRGVGAELLDRQLMLAHGLARQCAVSSFSVQMFVESDQSDLVALATDRGFKVETIFSQYRKEALDLLQVTAVPSFLSLQNLNTADVYALERAYRVVHGTDENVHSNLNNDFQTYLAEFDAEWSIVAVDSFADRPEIAGYALCSQLGAEDTNTIEGYIDEIAVLPKWHGRGIELQLLQAVANAVSETGVKYIGLDLAESNLAANTYTELVSELKFERLAETHILSKHFETLNFA